MTNIQQAVELMQQRQFNEAIPFLLKDFKPDSNEINYYLGVCNEKTGDPETAESYFLQAIKGGKDGFTFQAYIHLASLLKKRTDTVSHLKALNYLENALEVAQLLNLPNEKSVTLEKIARYLVELDLLSKLIKPRFHLDWSVFMKSCPICQGKLSGSDKEGLIHIVFARLLAAYDKNFVAAANQLDKALTIFSERPEMVAFIARLQNETILQSANVSRRTDELNREDLTRLYEIGQALSSVLDLDVLLTRVVDEIIAITQAERGFVMLKDEAGELQFRIARDNHQEILPEESFQVSQTIIRQVIVTGEPTLLTNIESEQNMPITVSIMTLQLKSALCVPLKLGDKLFGVIYVDNSEDKGNFTERELNILSTLASQTAIAIDNAKLYGDLQKAHRQLIQLDEMKSKFVDLTSHELRTPLAIIIGAVQVLDSAIGTPETLLAFGSQLLKMINNGTDRLNKLIENITSIVRQKSPTYDLTYESTSINDLIQQLAHETAPFFEQRQQELVINLPDENIQAEINQNTIWQAIMNLVLNAIRFTPDEGRIKIDLEADNDTIFLTVSDTGIGIPAQEFDNIFKEFYVIADTRKHSSGTIEFCSGGMGIGLSIAKAGIELHGGSIRVESQLKQGSRFHVVIPRFRPAE